MGEAVDETCATLDRLQSSRYLLHGVVAGVDTAQQQMRVQLEHQAVAIDASSTKHDDTTHILQALLAKLQILEGASTRPPLDEPGPESTVIFNAGHSVARPSSPHWQGNTAGATSTTANKGLATGVNVLEALDFWVAVVVALEEVEQAALELAAAVTVALVAIDQGQHLRITVGVLRCRRWPSLTLTASTHGSGGTSVMIISGPSTSA
jgi:hypothetical protein